ncbi:hypothetical protein ACXZ1M_08900 [Duganella sp. PWIR1]
MTGLVAVKEFGNPSAFAFVCQHEPIPNERGHVYGRMCIKSNEKVLGDFDEPVCMLNVTASHLEAVISRLPELDTDMFVGQDDLAVWGKIDKYLYLDDERSNEELANDSEQFSKFDFLTNGGESFDDSKSFIIREGSRVRILFVQGNSTVSCMSVHTDLFKETVQAFLEWINTGGK